MSVRERLESARAALGEGDVAELKLEGRLIRPRLAAAVLARGGWRVDEAAFWRAALAVQMVHEASLVHDDVVDGASRRRGGATWAAEHGVESALLYGDRLLAAGLRAAIGTGSAAVAELIATAADRTVAGERAQRAAAGRRLDEVEYRRIVGWKTGELLGAATAIAPTLAGDARAGSIAALGRRLGLLYQMADDLLDYCPRTDRGKPALRDLAEGRWAWLLAELDDVAFDDDPATVAARLAFRAGGEAPLERAARRWRREVATWRRDCDRLLGGLPDAEPLLTGWCDTVDAAVAREVEAPTSPAPTLVAVGLAERIPVDWREHLARHSRSFHFAARFAPAAQRERIAAVYAFCRVTDDLVDETPAALAPALLDEWVALARRAHGRGPVGVALLDRAMGDAAAAGVPFAYVADLVEGMRMDVAGSRYRTLAELRGYTYRVASVVGLWLTELAGVHDPWVLERAAALGHAMQLTNILRDVGEDLDRGRCYLPESLLARHAVDPAEVRRAVRAGAPVPDAWIALLEDLMDEADAQYELAWEGVPALPGFLGRPVAIAAEVYRGIHDAIRANGHDDLTRRAHTGGLAKARLAWRGLRRLGRARRASPRPPVAASGRPALLMASRSAAVAE